MEAALAIAAGASLAGWQCEMSPVSDGGEGFLDAFGEIGPRRLSEVEGPLGEKVAASWVLGHDPHTGERLAVIESAQAIGLNLVGGPAGNDPTRASTIGVGQLINAAVKAGARQVVVGMGGSATTDGGLGAVDALFQRGRPPGAELLVACDVTTRFLEAAAVFAAQKGASPAVVELLSSRLARVAQLYEERFGRDIRDLPGSGSSGGLAGGLAAVGGRLVPGFDLVAARLSLAERVAAADLVVSGEGYVDAQSLSGKAVGGMAKLCAVAGVPLLVVAGDVSTGTGAGLGCISLVEEFGRDKALSCPAECITQVVADRLARGPSA